MEAIARISPQDTRKKVQSGGALLVCAYDDEQKFKGMRLEGAISFGELQAKLPSLPKSREVVFYCG